MQFLIYPWVSFCDLYRPASKTMINSPLITALASASLDPMWLEATHLYVPLSLVLTWAIISFPARVVSVPAGRPVWPTRLHSNVIGWLPWARHCRLRESPGRSFTWSGREVA